MAVLVARQDRNGCGLIRLAAPPSSNAPAVSCAVCQVSRSAFGHSGRARAFWLGGLLRRAHGAGLQAMSSSAMAENLRSASTVSSPTFIEVDRGLQVLVTENAAHELVIGRVFLQDKRRGQVAKLMRRHPDADLFGDAVDDLTAQGSLGLMPIRLAGKEPGAGYSGIAFGLGVVLHHGIGPISLPRVRRLLGSFPTALCPAQRRWPRALPAAPRDAPILQGKRPRLVPSAVVLPRT